jgi:uncharacterized protein (DUF1684 family)
MSRIVIACYRPKAGQQEALRSLIRDEWASAEAIQAAHGHPVVLKMWEEYSAVCDYLPVAQVPEASQMFSDFTPIAVHA